MTKEILRSAVLLLLTCCACDDKPLRPSPPPPLSANAEVAPTKLAGSSALELPRFDELFARVAPSVVNVRALQAAPPTNRPTRSSSLGSGFVLDAQGHVLCCASVVEDAHKVELELADGRILSARIVGRDPLSDLALLHVSDPQIPPALPTGSRRPLRPGAWVVAFGYPYGLSHSISAGMVSALRTAEQMEGPFGRILSDTAINPGCNGGPLLDEDGRVVGINLVPPGGTAELGMALPWADVADRVQTLIENQRPDGR